MSYLRSYSVPVTKTRSLSIQSRDSRLSSESSSSNHSAPVVFLFEHDETYVSLYKESLPAYIAITRWCKLDIM